MEDRTIIALLFERNEQGLAELSAKYGKEMKKTAENICRSPEDAEEVCNDTLSAVWSSIPPEYPRILPAYVYQIVRNLAAKVVRKRTAAKRDGTVSYDALADEIGDAFLVADDAGTDSAEIVKVIDRFLHECGETDRLIFVRRYYYADDLPDVAAAAHSTVGAVSVRLTRMRAKLRAMLEEGGIRL